MERQYLNLIQHILRHGAQCADRTGTGVKQISAASLDYDLQDGFGMLTTRKIPFKAIVGELLFFISGKTDTKILENQKIGIWKGNTSAEFLKAKGLPYNEGDMGPGYGHQWRHAGAEYWGCRGKYAGVDQLTNLISDIKEVVKTGKVNRRLLVNSWSVPQINEMALPPCHYCFQSVVDGQFLDMTVNHRSVDVVLGLGFNIPSYGLLNSMIAHQCGLIPRHMTHFMTNVHLYNDHIEQLDELLSREIRPSPRLLIDHAENIDSYQVENFKLVDYDPHPAMKFIMAV